MKKSIRKLHKAIDNCTKEQLAEAVKALLVPFTNANEQFDSEIEVSDMTCTVLDELCTVTGVLLT